MCHIKPNQTNKFFFKTFLENISANKAAYSGFETQGRRHQK